MATYQHLGGSGSIVIPTVVITDCSTDEVEDYEGPITRAKVSHPTSSFRSPQKKQHAGTSESESDTEQDLSEMSSTSSRLSSRKRAMSASKTKEDDWADVTDPEERRRRQNRIAQRKFREKARDLKEQAQRDAQNREHACRSYHIPESEELSPETECSGLPWGSFSMPFIIRKGHEVASQQGSRRMSHNQSLAASPQQTTSPRQYLNGSFSYGQAAGTYIGTTPSTGDDGIFYDESPYTYDHMDSNLVHPPDHGYGHGYHRGRH